MTSRGRARRLALRARSLAFMTRFIVRRTHQSGRIGKENTRERDIAGCSCLVPNALCTIRPRMKQTDRKSDRRPARSSERAQEKRHFHKPPQAKPESGLWLYGAHAVRGALSNPKRFVRRAVLTERAVGEIGQKLLSRVKHEITDMHGVSRILPDGPVHQGVALLS